MSVDRQVLLERVRAALQAVKHPRTDQSVMDSQQVQKIDIEEVKRAYAG